mgnify:CR=1 FL=1
MQRLHRKRIEVATKLWGLILKGYFSSREDLCAALKNEYRRLGIEPIRGKSKIKAYDKELATVYLVGKYGLGISPYDYPKVFKKFFSLELSCEAALDRILSGENPRIVMEEIFNEVTEDIIFRVIRLTYISVLLEFKEEEILIELLKAFEDSYPELSERFRRFKKFYIAFRIAEAIVARDVRNRLEKEALKHALCLKLNATRAAPSDNEVRMIATEVLGMPEYIVNDVLKAQNIELEPMSHRHR